MFKWICQNYKICKYGRRSRNTDKNSGPFSRFAQKGEVFEGGGVNNGPMITTMTTTTTRDVNRISMTTTDNKHSVDVFRID